MKQDLQSDRDLARRAAAGDESSWERIFQSTADRLFSLLCFQTGDRNEAKDLLQETYLQAFRRLDAYRAEAPLEFWLRSIALRKAMDWKRGALRRLKRHVNLNEAMNLAGPQREETGEDHALLYRALGRLSERQRATLLLREWEGHSFREIAELLGMNESTARVHHTRARAVLRQVLRAPSFSIGAGVPEGRQS